MNHHAASVGPVTPAPVTRAGLSLGAPPHVVSVGLGVHGVTSDRDLFCLPSLWQLHLYQYAADLIVDGTPYALRPGWVSLIPPGARVEYRYRGRSEHLYVHFELPAAAQDATGETVVVPVVQDPGPAGLALRDLLTEAVAAAPHSPRRVSAEVWAALWRVASPSRGDAGDPALEGPRAHVRTAVAYIESRLHEPLTVPEVARAAGISHNQLIRLFRAELGSTVVAYIRGRRMARGAHLLRETTLSVSAVGAAVGIPDLQAFNKACRREFGASPTAVRTGGRSRPGAGTGA